MKLLQQWEPSAQGLVHTLVSVAHTYSTAAAVGAAVGASVGVAVSPEGHKDAAQVLHCPSISMKLLQH